MTSAVFFIRVPAQDFPLWSHEFERFRAWAVGTGAKTQTNPIAMGYRIEDILRSFLSGAGILDLPRQKPSRPWATRSSLSHISDKRRRSPCRRLRWLREWRWPKRSECGSEMWRWHRGLEKNSALVCLR